MEVKYLRRILPIVVSGALVAAPAAAEKTIRAPDASTIAIMGDTAQALLWDSAKGEYLLVKAGDHFQGYFVVTIEDDHIVVAQLDNPKVRHELRVVGRRPARSGLTVMDPYSAGDKLAPLDPYAAPPSKTAPRFEVEPTVVTAPPQSRATTPKPKHIGVPPVEKPTKPAAAPEPEPEPEQTGPTEHPVKLTRVELDDALSDFDRLSREVQLSRVAGGGVRIAGIAKGSLFYRTGLRKGDVVRAIAGERLTDMEAAARVYARVQASNEFDVEVDRSGRRIIFAFALK